MESPFMTTEELAEYVRMPVSTVHSWRSKRLGPKGIRVGRRVLYNRRDVEAWLADAATR